MDNVLSEFAGLLHIDYDMIMWIRDNGNPGKDGEFALQALLALAED
ncbi:MAG: hypothetical protein KGI08_09440 [Thaumarchaeota archaeon]|nr:hypothetical protein [Nitrososphaerota archaeon]